MIFLPNEFFPDATKDLRCIDTSSHARTRISIVIKNVFFFFIDVFIDEFVLFFFLFGTQKLREEEEQNESEIDRVVVVGEEPTRGRIGNEHEREFKTKKE